jgi:hypothetical protein
MDIKNIFYGFFWILVIMYSSLVRPDIPKEMEQIFKNRFVKLIMYSGIVWVATKDLYVAIIISIGYFITMSMINELNITEGFIEGLNIS